MRLGRYLTNLTLSELESVKKELNLTDQENIILIELSKGRSIVQIADKCCLATSSVSNRIRHITNKLEKIL